MADTKQTPRQKMIGMMYLVLTALLALNVSKDILNAFIVVNGSLENTNENFVSKINNQYADFDKAKQFDEKKAKGAWEKAQSVKQISQAVSLYIESLKKKLVMTTEGLTEKEADTMQLAFVKNKDNYDVGTNIMIGESEDGSAGLSRELKNKLNDFKKKMMNFIEVGDKKDFKISINTDDPKNSEENENWELYNFYHTPLVASVTILSKFQTDVKKTESDVLEYLYGKIGVTDFKFDTIAARVISPSNYVLLGEEYNADVFVAAFSTTQNPTVKIGNYDFATGQFKGNPDSVYTENGMGKYKIKTSKEGIFEYSGEISMKSPSGAVKKYPFKSEYIVARPSVTVSADMMNVFYAGVSNPVSISVPGVASENIIATPTKGSLVKTGNGKYNFTSTAAGLMKISVSAKMPDGTTRPMGTIDYRIKSLPLPIPVISTKINPLVIQKGLIQVKPFLQATYGDGFDFKATPIVTSFKLVIFKGGNPMTMESKNGNFTTEMLDFIKTMKTGQKLLFEDIVMVGPDNIPHKTNLMVGVIN